MTHLRESAPFQGEERQQGIGPKGRGSRESDYPLWNYINDS